METRKCIKCNEVKERTEFYKVKGSCKVCHIKYQTERNAIRNELAKDKYPAPDESIYAIKDAAGTIIYIGESTETSHRLWRHFRQNNRANVKYKAGTSEGLTYTILWEGIGDEALRLYLESRLIQHHDPKFNYQLKPNRNGNRRNS